MLKLAHSGEPDKKLNHFGCICCGYDKGSELPISTRHTLVQGKISASYRGMMIHYPEFSFHCDECGHAIRTQLQTADLELEREAAEAEADLVIALREYNNSPTLVIV